MSVYENVRERMTVREFKPDPVPEPVVKKLLQAGRWAPSSRNRQPWRFVVIRDREVLGRVWASIATSGRFLADAPLAIAILMEGADSPELDAGRALQQMELVAWEEGLGTCFVGLPTAEQQRGVKELLGIPDGVHLITVLPFGYRARTPQGQAAQAPVGDSPRWEVRSAVQVVRPIRRDAAMYT